MDFRHEWKHEINYSDFLVIRQRLRAVAKPDENAKGGKYLIRSLYFDSPTDKVLREKLNGQMYREKFRIRLYNGNINDITLEKKSKLNGLGTKQKTPLTTEQAQAIAEGDFFWMHESTDPLIQELYYKITTQGLRPKTIVDYIREPFVYGPGNVRVTLDYDIRTGLGCTDFLNPDCPMILAGDVPIILEVKWDEFLPSIIRDAVQLTGRCTGNFSKYSACRIYG